MLKFWIWLVEEVVRVLKANHRVQLMRKLTRSNFERWFKTDLYFKSLFRSTHAAVIPLSQQKNTKQLTLFHDIDFSKKEETYREFSVQLVQIYKFFYIITFNISSQFLWIFCFLFLPPFVATPRVILNCLTIKISRRESQMNPNKGKISGVLLVIALISDSVLRL